MDLRSITRLERQLVEAISAPNDRRRIPEAGSLVWRWFRDLHATRSSGLGGPHAISFAEIEAYGRLFAIPFAPHHVRLIKAMDNAWLDQVRSRDGKDTFATPAAAPNITPSAFDAVFS